MKRILVVILFCILITTAALADQTETTTPKYKCAKGHVTEGLFISAGKMVFLTCPTCLQEWADKKLPKVTEVKLDNPTEEEIDVSRRIVYEKEAR